MRWEEGRRSGTRTHGAVPDAEVALCIRMHGGVAGVPEEEASNELTCSDPRRALHIGEILSTMMSSRGFPGKES